MEEAQYLDHLSVDGAAALTAGRQALDARVPTCPAWTVADLLGHLGRVHRWVEEMVRTKAGDRGSFPEAPSEKALPGWYEEGLAMLLEALGGVGPDDLVWNWMARAPAPARFWPRRMAHETAVHRWDAQNAVGDAHAIDSELAVDGIEEYLDIVAFILAEDTPKPGLSGTLGLRATDTAYARTVRLHPDALQRSGELETADATVRATASDLLLWVCGRRSLGDRTVDVEGDRSVAERWAAISFD